MKKKSAILIVDDDPNDGEIITRAFRKSTSECVPYAVTSSVEALIYLQGQPPYSDPGEFPFPGLVTLDSKMPDSGKWDVLVWIRQEPELRKLPVVILCGSADAADEQLAKDLGANAYYIKPQDFDDFTRTIEQIAKRWLRQSPEPS